MYDTLPAPYARARAFSHTPVAKRSKEACGKLYALHALGSRAQLIKLWELGASFREHSTFRYFEGFLGARIAPVSCLAFHPRELHLFAAGSTASVVTLYAGKGERFSRQ